ncbi:right-handed parallel beta-helix repeat-containing protein [Natrinema caseinilyticum]|uniref:right-handed parallel beta-helix repeat-containing protein n=1 Tax=Natrinema caseinilyticum TaxID=2961570 RepID=UPI0020C1C567|nr:hypothetical protein [Natrinema caseinilyticum]
MTGTDDPTNRRALLRALGTASITGAIAGCSELALSSPEGEPEPGESSDPGADPDADDSADPGGDQPSYGACQPAAPDPNCDGTEVSASLSSDTVWGDECSNYHVTTEIWVSDGATLTIRPGTTVTFASGASLQVLEGSSLTAQGTCEAPIRMTGEQKTRGYWGGLVFYGSNSLDNKLRHVIVEYAGANRSHHSVRKAGVELLDARATVERCTIRENAGAGISLRYDAVLDAFDRCLVTANETTAACRDQSAHHFAAESQYTGNDDDRVRVTPTSGGIPDSADVERGVTDARYVLTGVTDNYGRLTVAPNATVSFQRNAGLDTRNGGSPTAVGMTEDESVAPITFTGEQRLAATGADSSFRIPTAPRTGSATRSSNTAARSRSTTAPSPPTSRSVRARDSASTVRPSAKAAATGSVSVRTRRSVRSTPTPSRRTRTGPPGSGVRVRTSSRTRVRTPATTTTGSTSFPRAAVSKRDRPSRGRPSTRDTSSTANSRSRATSLSRPVRR